MRYAYSKQSAFSVPTTQQEQVLLLQSAEGWQGSHFKFKNKPKSKTKGPEAGPARANPAPGDPEIPGGSRAMDKTQIYRWEVLRPSTRQALLTLASPGEGTEESGSCKGGGGRSGE